MKHFSIIIVSIMAILNVVIYYSFTSYKKETAMMLFKEKINKQKYEKKVENVRKLLLLQYQLNGKHIDSIFANTDISYKNNVVLLFSENHCKSCVRKLLQELYFLSEKSGFNNFILAGCYKDKDIFIPTADSLDYKFKHVFINKEKNNFIKFEYPTVFFIDNNYRLRLIYVYDYSPDMIFTYFRKILPNYLITLN